eukprot:7381708-Prymnesium_polylepis.3
MGAGVRKLFASQLVSSMSSSVERSRFPLAAHSAWYVISRSITPKSKPWSYTHADGMISRRAVAVLCVGVMAITNSNLSRSRYMRLRQSFVLPVFRFPTIVMIDPAAICFSGSSRLSLILCILTKGPQFWPARACASWPCWRSRRRTWRQASAARRVCTFAPAAGREGSICHPPRAPPR